MIAFFLVGLGWLLDGVPVCLAPGNQFYVDAEALSGGRIVAGWSDPRRGVGYGDFYGTILQYDGLLETGWTRDGNVLVETNDGSFTEVSLGESSAGFLSVSNFHPGFVDRFQANAGRWTETGGSYPGWPPKGLNLCEGRYGRVAPMVVSDGSAGVVCVWQQDQAGPDSSDVFALRIESEGAIGSAWPKCGKQLSSGQRENTGVAGTSDGSHGAYVGWYTNGGVTGGTTLVVQRIRGDASIAPDWPDSGYQVQLGAQVDFFYPPAMVSDGAGGVYVAWRGQREDPDFGVFAIHLGPDATPAGGWPPIGLRLATTSGAPLRVQACSDGRGGAWITWDDRRTDAGDIYAMAIPSTIDTAIGLDMPVPVCRAAGMQQRPVIAPDDSGGVVIAWEDSRHGPERDIYALRLLFSGEVAPGWVVDGLPVCVATADQFNVNVVSDGAQGAVFLWSDQRNGFNNVDLYAQRISGDGVIGSTKPPPPPPPLPQTVRLLSPHPNPAVNVVRVAFELPRAAPVSTTILDIRGRRIRELARAVTYPAGVHSMLWDGMETDGRRVSPGMYLVRFEADGVTSSAKVCVLR